LKLKTLDADADYEGASVELERKYEAYRQAGG